MSSFTVFARCSLASLDNRRKSPSNSNSAEWKAAESRFFSYMWAVEEGLTNIRFLGFTNAERGLGWSAHFVDYIPERKASSVFGAMRGFEGTAKDAYDTMILEAHGAHIMWNVCASGSAWALLAGYLLCPAAYGALQTPKAIKIAGEVGQLVQNVSFKLPAIVLSSIICGLASACLFFLWQRRRENVFWVSRQILIPVVVHSFMGVFSTLTNIYFSRDGEWSTFAKVSVAIMAAWLVATGMLAIWYELLISTLNSNEWPVNYYISNDGILSEFQRKQRRSAGRTSVKR